MSIEDLRAIAERVRAEAEAAGELAPPMVGKARWDVPESVRAALLEDLASGRYDRSARAVTDNDPEMAQG
jgi:hypothetical protein